MTLEAKGLEANLQAETHQQIITDMIAPQKRSTRGAPVLRTACS
jgi:hypothetical protein